MAAQQESIPRVKLGTQGLEVSKLGYGCMGLSGVYNDPVFEEDGIAIIKEAFGRGITHFDSSDIYGVDYHNEYLLGKALKQLPREKVELATKFGINCTDPVIIKGSAEYARSCCEASLKRLQVDYIDLFYIHRIDTTVPIEETMGELKKMVGEGKIKYIGISEASIDTVRRAHAVHPLTAYQMEYSLWSRHVEEKIIPVCRFFHLRSSFHAELIVKCNSPKLLTIIGNTNRFGTTLSTYKTKNLTNNCKIIKCGYVFGFVRRKSCTKPVGIPNNCKEFWRIYHVCGYWKGISVVKGYFSSDVVKLRLLFYRLSKRDLYGIGLRRSV